MKSKLLTKLFSKGKGHSPEAPPVHPVLGITGQEFDALKKMHTQIIRSAITATGDNPKDAYARADAHSSVQALTILRELEKPELPRFHEYEVTPGFELKPTKT